MTIRLALLVTLLGSFACSKSDNDAKQTSPAVTEFWTAFEAQNYDALSDLRPILEAAVETDPTNAETTLLLAHANLWTVSEFTRNPTDPSALPTRVMDALRYFDAAGKLAPDDARIVGWLGAVQIGAGNFTGDTGLIEVGRQNINKGVALFPEFNLYVRALTGIGYPASDPLFDEALSALWTTLDLCAGETVSRDALDYTKYLSRQTTTGPQRVCWNPDKAPHNYEGYFFFMGDALLKAGDVDRAQKVYDTVSLLDSYKTWPFRATFEDAKAHLADRAALYADADPQNDPPFGGQDKACAICHATK